MYDREEYFLAEVEVYLLVQMTKLLVIYSEATEDKPYKHLFSVERSSAVYINAQNTSGLKILRLKWSLRFDTVTVYDADGKAPLVNVLMPQLPPRCGRKGEQEGGRAGRRE